jgi:hypothetical protein
MALSKKSGKLSVIKKSKGAQKNRLNAGKKHFSPLND